MIYDRADYEKRPVVPLDFLASSTVRVRRLQLQVSQLVAVEPTALPNLLPWVQQLFVHEDKTWGERRSPAVRLYFLSFVVDGADQVTG